MPADNERLEEIKTALKGRIHYEGQIERWDEFLVRLIEEQQDDLAIAKEKIVGLEATISVYLKTTEEVDQMEMAAFIRGRDVGEKYPGMRPTPELWRHRTRGTTYEIVGNAMVQSQRDAPLWDDELVLLYRSVETGCWFVRRSAEFHDGRFEKVD